MKQFILFSLVCFSFLSLSAQNTYVPDDNFEQKLIDLGLDDTLDNYVLTANIENVTNLFIPNLDIEDLTGIEDFTALETLTCYNNQLTNLNLDQNIALSVVRCYSNQLTELSLTGLMYLTELRCQNNQLTSLDISSNLNLSTLYATANPNLSCIQIANIAQVENSWNSLNPNILFNENCANPDVSTQERNALIAFYNATGGTNWTNITNWTTTTPVTEWYGVTVEEISGFLRITEINLSNNNLTGNLPDLVDLPELRRLYLANNNLTGGVVLSNDHLQELHLNNTNISSLNLVNDLWNTNVTNGQLNFRHAPNLVCVTVPTSNLATIRNLPLEYFDYGLVISDDCSNPVPVAPAEKIAFYEIYDVTNGPNWNVKYNDMFPDLNSNNTGFVYTETSGYRHAIGMDLHGFGLNGEIPANLETFSNLESLNLSNNNGLTALPPELGNLTNLTDLRFNNCSIEVVPITIENLTNLNYLQFNNNDITLLPEQIGTLINLEALVASPNPFPSIPVEIGNLVNLEYLDLSGSLITNIPVAIGGLDNLTELYLDDNEIELIPENSIGNLTTLTTLRLDNNNITELPEDIGNLVDLTQLTLNYNELTTLPSGIGNLINLVQLTLQNNLLETLPESFGNLNLLTNLDFSGGNKLAGLPESFGNLSNLSVLNLYNNQLESLPESFGNLSALTELNLANQYYYESGTGTVYTLTTLPESFNDLTTLTSLNLSNNALEGVIDLSNLVNLSSSLLIHNNKISGLKIGYEYNGVPNLKISANNNPNLSCIEVPTDYLAGWQNATLPTGNIDNGVIFSDNCSGSAVPQSERNALIAIYNAYHNSDYESAGYWQYWDPDTDGLSNVGSWQGVTTGYIDGQKHVVEFDFPYSSQNIETAMPEELGDLLKLTRLNLNETYYGQTKIASLPGSIGNLQELEELNISYTAMEELPEGFGNLSSLTQLSMTSNAQLTNLSDDFGDLGALVEANISSNQNLMTLPDSFGSLSALIDLDLSNNNSLTSLPDSFGDLISLKVLDLDINGGNAGVETLPESFGNLTSLEELDLASTNLTTLPESFGDLTSLAELSFYAGTLQSLPESFGNLSALTELNLANQSYYESGTGTVYTLTTLPETFNDLTTLTSLNLSNNALEGVIDLSNLVNLSSSLLIHNNKISGLKIGYEYNGVPNLKISANNNPNLSCIEVPTAYLEGWQNINLPTGNIDNGVIFSDNCAGSAIPQSERNALITIYNAYHNPDYESAGYWQYWDPNPDGLSNVGSWQGVTTGYIDEQKHVVEFDFPYSSQNIETAMPEELGDLLKLTKLNLNETYYGQTKIASLPGSIGNLQELEELNISYTAMEELPEGFGNLSSLTQLSMTSNAQLTNLSDDFGDLGALVEANISSNQNLMTLPDSFGSLSALIDLDLSNNNSLTSLPDSFGDLISLKVLDLDINGGNAGVETLPESFGNLTSLEELDLASTNLTTLPESFGDLTSLAELSFYAGTLQSLPESFGNLSALTELNLANQSYYESGTGTVYTLTTLPETFNDLTTLTSLNLSNNALEGVIDLSNLVNLSSSLLIHNNKISGLKIGYEYNGVPNLKISANNNPNLSCIEVPTAYLEGWQNINLPTGNIDNGVIFSDNCAGSAIPQSERNALITIYNAYHNPDYESAGYWQYWDPNPDGLSNVGSWQGVTTGYIDGQKHVVEFVMPGHSYNNLTAEFPEELGNLTQLVKFELPFVCCGHTHGYITSFPESIGDLSHLEELFIRQSGIEQLPEGFGNLAALQQLSITNNAQLNSLSEDFGELSALIELNLTHNALESLPLSFGDLYETLTNLDLSYNDITGELPFNFNTFTLLTQLYLRDNSMEGYLNLGNLELLTRLDIQNNLFNGLKLAVSPTAMQGNCGNGNPCYFNAENNNMYCIEVPTDELVSWQLANTNVDNCVIFSDHCGEEVSSDTTPPTVVTQNITVNLTEEGTLMITPESVMHYTTQDECSIGTAELDITSFDCSHIGENTVTLTVYDISGNSASQSAIVTVTENTPPTIATQDLTVNLGSNGEVTIAPEDIDNGSEDNCGITLMELSQSTFNCSHIGENQIYLEVEDASGNSSWEYVTITITETTPPTVLTQSLSVELDENGTASITPEQIDNGSTDNCGIATSSLNITNFDCSHIGENTVTFSITDTSGNESSATAVVTVIETTPPTVLTQSLSVELDENGTASITPEQIDNGSTDNCGIATSSLNITNFDCSHIGENTVTFSITDTSGNESSATAVVTVIETTPPTVLTQSLSVELDENGTASITPEQIDNGSTDNCGIATSSLDITSFDCSHIGENTVTFSITDTSGNESSATAVVTVIETTPPTVLTQSLSVELDENGTASITPEQIDNGSTDNCDIATSSLDITSFDCSHIGENTVTFSITDTSGNESSATAVVTVIETTPPTVLTQSLSVELDENGTASITPEQIDNGSTDNCGIATSSLNITSFDCSHIGENTVTLSITDTNGNESSATAVVTVIETTPPTVLTQSLSVELDENGTASITPGQVNDGSSDNCGIATSSLNITNFDCSHIGENTVTLSITDASGNENSATALITIIDNEAPVVEAQDIEVDLAGEDSISIVPEQVDNGSYDNCVVTFTLNQDTFTEVGEYQVTFTATDIAGNTTSINVTVTVLDTLGVQENQKSFLSVYPVPAKDYLNFKIANNDRINSVEIYDLRGRKVQYIKSPVNTINLVDLQSGMYLFKFNLQEITLTKKIIIQ